MLFSNKASSREMELTFSVVQKVTHMTKYTFPLSLGELEYNLQFKTETIFHCSGETFRFSHQVLAQQTTSIVQGRDGPSYLALSIVCLLTQS